MTLAMDLCLRAAFQRFPVFFDPFCIPVYRPKNDRGMQGILGILLMNRVGILFVDLCSRYCSLGFANP